MTYNANGTMSSSPTAGNDVSGWYLGDSTGWWNWSSWWSGSSGGSSSSSSWSASGADSYEETVDYPGFYEGAFYGGGYGSGGGGGGGGPIEYIGDLFSGGSGSGSGGMMMLAMEGESGSVALEGEDLAVEEAEAAIHGGQVWNLPGQFEITSPMWNRRGGLGFFMPQRGGPTIEIDADRAGNIRGITDALGNRAVYGYDRAGNVTSVTDPNGDATRFGYDSDGRLTQVVDALHNQTDFRYDEDGLLTEETIVVDGETLTRSYEHDEAGNVVREVDRNGRVTVFGYDQSGRMTEEIWYATAADADADVNRQNTITWTYDESGNLTSVIDNYSAYTYQYDSQGRLVSETVAPAGGPVTVLTVGYGTREDDLPVSLSAAVDGLADFLTTFEYDTLDRVVGIRQTGQGGNQVADKYVTFAYSESGALEELVRYESLDTSAMVAVSRYTYDQYGRLVALDHFQDPNDPLAAYTWTYEGGGLVEINSPDGQTNPLAGFGLSLDSLFSSTTTDASVNPLPDHVWTFDAAFTGLMTQMTSPDGVAAYSYDRRGQLTSASYDYQDGESYLYDANGNRTGGGDVVGDHNRLLSDGTYNYEYDAEGNRIKRTAIATDEVTQYVWDHRNRLVSVIDRLSEGGPVVQSVEYVYDSQNRWIGKSVDPDGDGPEEASETHFVYQGNQIVLQIDGEGEVTNRYLWGPAVDQILADEQVGPDGSSEVLWTLTDHLNTVRDLADYDPETDVTTVVNHIVYDAFGRVTGQTDASVTTLFGFTARPFDADTGLQNNLNRWYDAETGTWISVDPIGFAAGDANLYRYVGNEATAIADPTGLAPPPGYPYHGPTGGTAANSEQERHARIAMAEEARTKAAKAREEAMKKRAEELKRNPPPPPSPPPSPPARTWREWVASWFDHPVVQVPKDAAESGALPPLSGAQATPHIAQRLLLSTMQERVNKLREEGAKREFIEYAEGELEAARTGQLKEFHDKNQPPDGFQPFKGPN